MTKLSFSIFFRRVKESTDLTTQQALAKALGVNRSAVTQAKQRDAVPEKWVLKIARMFALSPDWLETGSGNIEAFQQAFAESELYPVPKVEAKLCAGGGSLEVGTAAVEEHIFQLSWLQKKGNPRSMVLMDVIGDSMEPEIYAGDTVLVDQSHTTLRNGTIFAVGVEDAVMVKRVEKKPEGLILHSDNPAYSPVYLRGDELETVRIIGKVIWVGREYQ
ncbi:LexA family transcriptional regulator [Oleidesulfovibrio sp.]|uniref:LexA family transcriptional regulator n=1 Tax=Oleidesulfovibrio sp. TaxID=2909707 RepID=UPI003A8375B7